MGFLNVVGVELSSGTYEGRDFNNVIIHCTSPFVPDKGVGDSVERVKVKRAIIDFIPTVGDRIQVFYNRYGQVESVQRIY